MTDNQIKEQLAPFISNVEARSKKLLPKLDLRMLYTITKNVIAKYKELSTLDINVLINNTLIFNLTDSILKQGKGVEDSILLGVIENKSFLGIKKPKR